MLLHKSRVGLKLKLRKIPFQSELKVVRGQLLKRLWKKNFFELYRSLLKGLKAVKEIV